MTPILEVKNLRKTYYSGYRNFKRQANDALKPISFELQPGETLAIVGEAGSGKSTLAKILVGAESRTGGDILFDGTSLERRNVKQRCRLIRMIFQDPNTSLNPRLTIGELLDEPLKFNTLLSERQRYDQVMSTLKQVGLLPEHADFYPHMISEGQKQRVAVARALMLNPKVIIADEALTALDLSVRAQILNLLIGLQQDLGLSFIFVSHNLNIIRHISDNVIVMKDGEIVEQAETQELFTNPQHPYTKKLLRDQELG
ncbi:peptide ABC transporter ATP-binding protein [Shewanella sp. OPT22]|nr:peptide ABC transporter ATP-binding protein [Shewanella sp. OPT22]